MTAWDDRLRTSQTWVLANQFTSMSATMPEPRDDAELEAQQRLRRVAELVNSIVLNGDPSFVSPRMISDTQTPLGQVVNALQTYISGGDVTYLANANSYSDELVAAVATWVTRPAREARQTVAALGRDASALIDSLRRSEQQLSDQLSSLGPRIDEVQAEATARLGAVESAGQISLAALEKKIAEQQASLDAEKLRIDATVRESDTTFKATNEARDREFRQLVEGFMERSQESIAKEEQAFGEADTARRKETNEIMDDLHKLLGDAQKVTSAVAGKAVSQGFGERAKDENRASWALFIFGSLIVGGVALFGYGELQSGAHITLDLWWIALRVLIILPVLGLAVWAFAQSSNHRQQERNAHSIQLQFAALDPYLASLGEAEQARLRGLIAERAFFTSQEHSHGDRKSEVTTRDVLDLVRDAIKQSRT